MTVTEPRAHKEQFGGAEVGAIAHLYRGELYRSKVWRTRLDTTTNWAVVTTGIAMSVTYSTEEASPLPIVLVSLLLAVFWVFEARRYRFFDVWRTRVRVMETGFYGPILRGQGMRTDRDWNQVLADDYTGVYFHIGYMEALGRRLRRNYSWIFAVQVVSYWGKIAIHPTPLESLDQLWARTAVGPLPGPVVLAIGMVFYLGLVALAMATARRQRAVGRGHRARWVEDRMRTLASTEMY